MKPRNLLLLVVVGLLAGPALADWMPGDPYKMHYPQLPDPYGWDVQAQNYPLADDWMCTQSGPVRDIHVWFSMEYGMEPFVMNSVYVRIYDDVSASQSPTGYSMPGQVLWERPIPNTAFTVRQAGTGTEGWYDPVEDIARYPDHYTYYQLNIPQIVDPFVQERGKIYWLNVQYGATSYAGWKTSLDRWNDDAVYWLQGAGWQELIDPTGKSLDLAFVITPEPGTIGLLLLGGLAALRRRR